MEKVIDTFLTEAGKSNDWKLELAYKWILNADASGVIDVVEALDYVHYGYKYQGGF